MSELLYDFEKINQSTQTIDHAKKGFSDQKIKLLDSLTGELEGFDSHFAAVIKAYIADTQDSRINELVTSIDNYKVAVDFAGQNMSGTDSAIAKSFEAALP